MTTQKTQRVQKLLSAAGFCSRRKAEELIKEGRVTVNGTTISIGDKANPSDAIAVDGQDVSKPRKLYHLFHKPAGYVTALSDPEHETIMQFINSSERVFPVGRLDKDTTGFLLLTNDGDFANKVMHPRNEVQKTYRVMLAAPISTEQVQLLRSGIELRDGKTAPAKIKQIDRKYLEVTIHEGKNQIIKRMFKRLGFRVKSLERIATGRLGLGKLKPGEYRELSVQELEKLFIRIAVPPPATLSRDKREKLLTKKTSTKPRRRSTRLEHRGEAVSTRSLRRSSRDSDSSERRFSRERKESFRRDSKPSRFSRERESTGRADRRFSRGSPRSRDSRGSPRRFSRDRDNDAPKRFERSDRRGNRSARDSSSRPARRFSRDDSRGVAKKRFTRTDSRESRSRNDSRAPQRDNSRVRESSRFSRDSSRNERQERPRFTSRRETSRSFDSSKKPRNSSDSGRNERKEKGPERFDPNINYKARRKASERSGRKGGFRRKGGSSRSRTSSRTRRKE